MENQNPNGLFYPDGSFKTAQEMKASKVINRTPLGNPQNFEWWQNVFKERQQQRQEALGIPERISIDIATQSPILLGLIGDVHAAGENVDYGLLGRDISILRDMPNAYALCLGDLVDNFAFFPAANSDVGNMDEQQLYQQAMLKELKGKLLAGWGGNHEAWSGRNGANSYLRFKQEMDAHYLEGVSYIDLGVGDTRYKITGAHQHLGNSIYSHTAGAQRMRRQSAPEGDIFITAHTHQKGLTVEPVKRFGGENELVTYCSLGTYKSDDEYSRTKGFGRQHGDALGAVGLILHPGQKRVEPFMDLQVAAEALYKYM